jgi:hypothetical protein
MDRRKFLHQMGLTSAALYFPIHLHDNNFNPQQMDKNILKHIDKLKNEPPMKSEINVKNGGPRLYVNDQEIFPMLAMSTSLSKTMEGYTKSGINYYSLIIGLNSAWLGPKKYDFSKLDYYMAQLLAINPNACFLPRLHLTAPRWWEEAHPQELVKYGLPVDEKGHKVDEEFWEGGYNWHTAMDTYDPSLASKIWIDDLSHYYGLIYNISKNLHCEVE